jgi:Ser/Thr protein kinase RdoA (MazF antagonist)
MLSTSRILYFPRPSRLSHSIKSRFRSADIDPDSVKAILSAYGLELIGPPTNLPLSRRTRNVLVNTPDGRKVLKRYRTRLAIPNIIYSHSILEQLARVDFPAPRLDSTLDGKNYVHHAGRHYALFNLIEGKNYSLNFLFRSHRLRLMSLAGSTLGRLHLALQGFMPAGHHYLGFSSYSGGWQRDLNWFDEKVAELIDKSRGLERDEDRKAAAWLVEHANPILEEYAKLEQELRVLPLPRSIIHGDYGLHNLVLQKDDLIVPLDFESARLEWRLCDLVSCLSRLRYADNTYDFESMRYFLAAYQTEYRISMDEWQAMPQVWRFYRLRSAMIYWNSYFETGGPAKKLISARNVVQQTDWVLNNPLQILNLLPDVSS